MKIRITENEFYEINLPEEIGGVEFNELVNRLVQIQKMVARDPLSNLNFTGIVYSLIIKQRKKYTMTKKRKLTRPTSKSKKDAIIFLLTHYHGKMEDKLKWLEENGYEPTKERWVQYTKAVHHIIKQWEIRPEEVGMKEFPNRYVSSWHIGELKAIHPKNFQEFINKVKGGLEDGNKTEGKEKEEEKEEPQITSD
jgi:hypothetical protein